MGYPRTITADWYRIRWIVLERDDFTCQYCGRSAPSVPLEVDHKLAVADGGTDDLENLVTSCWSCNRGKGYARWKMTRLSPNGPRYRRGPHKDSKAGQMADLLLSEPDLTNNEIGRRLGLSIPVIRMYRHRLERAATGGTVNEAQPERLVRLLKEHGPMTIQQLQDIGHLRKERLKDVAREARNRGFDVSFLDGAYFLVVGEEDG